MIIAETGHVAILCEDYVSAKVAAGTVRATADVDIGFGDGVHWGTVDIVMSTGRASSATSSRRRTRTCSTKWSSSRPRTRAADYYLPSSID